MRNVAVGLLIIGVVGTLGLAGTLVPVSYYPAWINHWEDAGPLVAKYLGFYEEAGLDVTIYPGGPNLSPLSRMLNDRNIAFATAYNWQVLIARIEQGTPLKVIATDFQDPALHLVSWIPINSPEDLYGRKVEVWPTYEHPLLCYLGKDHFFYPAYPSSPGPEKAIVQDQGGNMARFLARQVTASHAMIYNELITVLNAFGFNSLEEYLGADEKYFYVYRYGDLDPELAWDENSLITTETTLFNYPEIVQKFVTATYQGWHWVMTHDPEDVFAILYTFNDSLEHDHEIAGGIEINKLMVNENTVEFGLGYVDPSTWLPMARRLFEAGLINKMSTGEEVEAAYQWVPSNVFPPE